MADKNASSGHKLGQLIGDWYEKYFVFPLLKKVANDLGLFVDSRFVKREVREGKILWDDLDGNSVDYDFVLELDGTDDPWIHRSSKMRCKTCMWFVKKNNDGYDVAEGNFVGRCRRHAPTMSGYPVVFPDDWCGDHKLDENKL